MTHSTYANPMHAPVGRAAARVALAALAAVVLAAAIPASARSRPWEGWSLDAKTYKKLNMFQRAQYDKAADLFRKGNYRAAAREFEKFRTQFADSVAISNVLFMQAYSHHWAKNRHTAIKIYHEVLDFFPDVVSDAAPAKYYLGVAHIDNGDIRKGLEVMREMVDDPRYQKHWLAAGALRRLADNFWKYDEYSRAVDYWKQTVRDFSKSNRREADQARDRVTAYYINEQNYTGYEDWIVNDERRDDAKHRRWVVEHALHILGRISHYPVTKAHGGESARRLADRKAYLEYYRGNRKWYEELEADWDYYVTLRSLARGVGDKELSEKALDEIIKMVKAIEDPAKRDGKWNWLIDTLRHEGDIARAEVVIGYMHDRVWAQWKRYELLAQQEKWKQCEPHLEAIEKTQHKTWAPRALKARAHLYKEHLRKYEEAIKLFHLINDPPRTLWHIAECYHAWGKLDKALTVLATIETMFPPEASRAAWRRTQYLAGAGRKDKAIASARRILKVYKRARESSYAHQLLEKYGIKTGGGVAEEQGF